MSARIAIVAAALRLPGAISLPAYWDVLLTGRDSITRSTSALPADGQNPLGVPSNASFVPAYGRIDTVTSLDAERFGMSPAEALLTDPQQRLLLEVTDEALHLAAVSASERRATGVFLGTGQNDYERVVRRHLAASEGVDDFAVELGTARDYVAGKVAYRLDLGGPAVNVLGACSTALLAVHLGCRTLQAGEADVVVAGASSVRFPEWHGYWSVPGDISAPDGVCRPFDARACGTVPADGVGVVVLRRLDDALASGCDILAVVAGSATNNDGRKPGFAGVSAASQETVIRAALRDAMLDPDAVGYVESHGTATRLGDAVEWSTLHRIFGSGKHPVQVGAVKGNVGHTREAAGIAGLLKAVQCLRHGLIPPTANFADLPDDLAQPDSQLKPVVNATPLDGTVAGVSAFGLGGSNCHLLLEAPPPRPATQAVPRSVILLSSHRSDTLEADTAALRDMPTEDVAARSHARDHRHPLRRYMAPDKVETRRAPRRPVRVAFVFPGVGSEYVGMGAGLARVSPRFAGSLAETSASAAEFGVDLAPVFAHQEGLAKLDLRRMLGRVQPCSDGPLPNLPARHLALLAVQLAFADMLAEAGVTPAAVLGHSLGEWTAAAVAGVLSRSEVVGLVAHRARLIEAAPPGVTLAVTAAADAVTPLLGGTMALAADNSPNNCTISGTEEDANVFEARLSDAGITSRRIGGTAAFHSRLLEPAAAALGEALTAVTFSAPRLPLASALSGGWASDLGAGYWPEQLVSVVRFREALTAVAARCPVVLEIGPGNVRSWTMQVAPEAEAVRTSRLSYEGVPDLAVYEQALARLWLHGHDPKWPGDPAARPHLSEQAPSPALHRRVFDPRLPLDNDTSPSPSIRAPSAALSGLTKRLADLWCDLLGVDLVDESDYFFDLGGDSLLGRHLIAAIAEMTGANVPGSVVFASGSLKGMARAVERWIDETAMVE
ncbi:type I polyketide synthase [Mesorhizobium sp. M6A.T.Ce.TU.016.01.1.1]|uniref:beta-ketoacyl synthase N-terminal-like domain-containing protein n=1 Tax=Mesorhizobium sp. M6A.T.Ce.TU.016.01.1.1 TaxID=2496783 RepID=UPI000FCA45F0|nr:type I polyketide synthase [Mesorhizobium sp. M6A.T.Ce.TU.016.01.1.1]RUU32398.1 type I polyketide synthase [Mesorhizobium sp. M6A.T.Ce.TU.016.01.1.1]